MMKKNKYQTKVITDLSDVPEGFVPIAESAGVFDRRQSRRLSQAQVDGMIPAVKLMRSVTDTSGPVFIDEKKGGEYLDWLYSSGRLLENPIDRLLSGTVREKELEKIDEVIPDELKEIRDLMREQVELLKQLVGVWK